MSVIRVGIPAVDGNRVEIPITTRGVPDRFVNDDMKLVYSRSVEGVPPSIGVLPAVGNLLPVAWASGSRLEVAAVDPRFDEAVDDLREAFGSLYPDLASERVLVPDSTAAVETDGSGAVLLFSGGVDSLDSYIRHREESPALVSVHGADVSESNTDGWRRVRRSLDDFADRHDETLVTVRSNCRTALEYPMLHSYFRESITNDWWGGVQHGLTLLTHCAPIAHELGASTVYIAATHTPEFSPPWGSSPEIDDAVAWNGTRVTHDGYDHSRQEKIRDIARYARSTGDTVTIRSCYESEAGDNCSVCEKCCRTIVGLEIAGVDPTDHGYRVDGSTFERVRRALQGGEWRLGRDEQFMWEDLQRDLPVDDAPHDGAVAFFDWFERQDVEDLRRLAQRTQPPVRSVEPYLKYLPEPVYLALKHGKRHLL